MADENKPITLSFSKKNIDIREILNEVSEQTGIKKTDYICEAVRFYYNNKDNVKNDSGLSKNEVEHMLESLLDKKLEKLLIDKDIKISKEQVDISDISKDDLGDD